MTTKEFQERSDLRIFLSYFKPHKKLFVLDMVCALTIALIDLAFPYLSRWCMYELLPQNAYRTFFTVMAVAAAAFAVRGVLTYIIGYYGHTFGILEEADIPRDLFTPMQELDFGYYDSNRTRALMSRLTSELFEITELAHHGPEDIFISGVTVIGALVIMLSMNVRLTLISMIFVPLMWILHKLFWGKIRRIFSSQRRREDNFNSRLQVVIQGMKIVKCFGKEKYEAENFDRVAGENAEIQEKNEVFWAKFQPFLGFVLNFGTLAVLYFGGVDSLKGTGF